MDEVGSRALSKHRDVRGVKILNSSNILPGGNENIHGHKQFKWGSSVLGEHTPVLSPELSSIHWGPHAVEAVRMNQGYREGRPSAR